MACDKTQWKGRRSYIEQENRRRLGASRGEFTAAVASEERDLRAAGVLDPDKSLLVNDAD